MHRLSRKFVIFASAVLLVAATTACEGTGSSAQGGKSDGAVAATVNGKDIPLKDVDQIINQQTNGQMSQLSPIQQATARIQALDSLIQQEVLFQRADKEKLLPSDDEVTQEIGARKRQGGMTEEDYQRMLQQSGQTEPQLREVLRKEIAIRKLLDKTVGKITIKDNEVTEFFNNNKERFVAPRGVGLSVIVADPTDSGGAFADDAKNDFEAQNKINDVHAALKRGEDFATVARKRSEDQSVARSGDIGFATEDQLKQNRFPQELITNLFGPMQVGSFTNPMKLEDGRYYIFKLTDRRLETENRTLESPGVRDEIKQLLISERQRVLSEALRLVALNEAKIVNNLATDILKDPNNLGGLSPAQPASATASPASATASPATAASPAAAK
ncbi:MAG TPA: SurA N-terminal domain-containing protein [Pyrinomonadaceae bacterium]|nr:SurA N-terminal domain-containing protein [Pyrinomonadaceae bacterium]